MICSTFQSHRWHPQLSVDRLDGCVEHLLGADFELAARMMVDCSMVEASAVANQHKAIGLTMNCPSRR